jgi:hypothetical protein
MAHLPCLPANASGARNGKFFRHKKRRYLGGQRYPLWRSRQVTGWKTLRIWKGPERTIACLAIGKAMCRRYHPLKTVWPCRRPGRARSSPQEGALRRCVERNGFNESHRCCKHSLKRRPPRIGRVPNRNYSVYGQAFNCGWSGGRTCAASRHLHKPAEATNPFRRPAHNSRI